MCLPQLRNALLATVVLVVAAGCGASETPVENASARSTTRPTTVTTPSVAPAKALTVDQMAAAVGCVPTPVGKTSDFRQATCTAPQGKLVLLDFDTVEGMRAWLDTALLYGGLYLVGDRWVLSAETVEYMETLRSEWGGTIEGR
jgi:hypothetical protein